MAASMDRYRVTITYSEPTYARTRGIDEVAYTGTFDVTAADPDGAIMLATELFHQAARSSSVGWERVIRSATWRVIMTTN